MPSSRQLVVAVVGLAASVVIGVAADVLFTS